MAAAAACSEEMFLSDSGYVLELNLQKVRKELISMIEIFEHNDCSECKQLKCSCAGTSPAPAPASAAGGGTGSDGSDDSDDSDDFSTVAPSANVLPKPMWENTAPKTSGPEISPKDVESWVRACTADAPPGLPEGAGGADRPPLTVKWTDRAVGKSTSDTTLSAILSKLPYDIKCRNRLYWPVHESRPAARAEAKIIPHLSSAKPCSDSVVDDSLGPYAGAYKSAVDAFFHSFRPAPLAAPAPPAAPSVAPPAAPSAAQTAVSFSSRRLAAAFKVQPQHKLSTYTYF